MADEKPTVSGYELRQTFTALSCLVERIPLLLSRELDSVASEGFTEATDRVHRVLETVKTFEELLKAKSNEVTEHFDKLWQYTNAAHESFSTRLASLPKLEEVKVPYNLKELVGLAERFQGLSDVAWARVVELAKALSNG